MAEVTFFDSFGTKWAQAGNADPIQDDQYRLGWSYIGSTPPSVEQFNKWGQLSDEKHNWLFGQLQSAAVAKDVTLAGDDIDGLLKILNKTAPDASTTVRGIAELATNAETQAGTDAARIVTPSGLSSRTATEARTGLIEIANAAEAQALASALLAITPSTLGAVLGKFGSDLPKVKTFAQAIALTEDIGPIIVIGMDGVWEWSESQYFTGYRHPRCGADEDGWTPEPLPFQIAATGGVWRESDEKERRVIARYRESGLVVPSASWIKGQDMIADIGGGNWKAPDKQDMFLRKAGTDADTANARTLGSYQRDAIQNITGSFVRIAASAEGAEPLGAFSGRTEGTGSNLSGGPLPTWNFSFDASRVARTSIETRGASSAVVPHVHV